MVASVLVNSPGGSGLTIYNDFSTALRDAWALGLEGSYQLETDKRLMGEDAPPELREGRRAFKTLLDRYDEERYTASMADEFNALTAKHCKDYCVTIDAVLPDDLAEVLDMAYPDDVDDVDDVDLDDAPPREEFDLFNDDHLAWLQKRLEPLADL